MTQIMKMIQIKMMTIKNQMRKKGKDKYER